MPYSQLLYQEVVTALHRADNDTPAVIEALRLLGVRNNTISEWTGVSPTMASFWASGKQPVAPAHYHKLTELLRVAYGEAIKAIGEIIVKSNTPQGEKSFRSCRDRVQRAGKILGDLEQR